jgi:ribosomal-protein-alanine N-acetyltransferase
MTVIRRGEARDLEEIARVQTASPEAAQWNPSDYLIYDLLVATSEDRVAGFLAARRLGGGEAEILNVAVAPEWRRRGVARGLLEQYLLRFSGEVFLEVRESNAAAIEFYKSMQFQEVTRRREYYRSPLEAAIVMKFHSCYCGG